METTATESAETLLARVNRELEHISDVQHSLARRRVFLQQQATRLRLGVSALEVTTALRAEALAEARRTGLNPARVDRVDFEHDNAARR